MTKYIYASMAALGMFAASCSSEIDAPNVGLDDGEVRYTVELPAGITSRASRAVSDGLAATDLKVYVYDRESKALIETKKPTVTDRRAEVSLQLPTGKKFDIVFWAQNPDAPYSYDSEKRIVYMNYRNANGEVIVPTGYEIPTEVATAKTSAPANDETRDAFFKVEQIVSKKGGEAKTIVLRRPFAQLNLGTTEEDLEWANKLHKGAEVTQTSLTVSTYTALQLGTFEENDTIGKAIGDLVTVDFPLTDFTALADNEKFPYVPAEGPTYKWISMNYLLCGAGETDGNKYTTEVTVKHNDPESGFTACQPLKYYNIPLQRNHRTNIFGQLLTKTDDFQVVINPIYDEPSYDVIEWAMVPALHKAADGTYYVDVNSNEPLTGATDSFVSRANEPVDEDNYMAFVQAFNAGHYTKEQAVDEEGKALDKGDKTAVTDIEVRFRCVWKYAPLALKGFKGKLMTYINAEEGTELTEPAELPYMLYTSRMRQNYLQLDNIDNYTDVAKATANKGYGVVNPTTESIQIWVAEGFKFTKAPVEGASLYLNGEKIFIPAITVEDNVVKVTFAKETTTKEQIDNFIRVFNAGLYDKNITIDVPEEFADIVDQLEGFEGKKLVDGKIDAVVPETLTFEASTGTVTAPGFQCSGKTVDEVNSLIKMILSAQHNQAEGYYDQTTKKVIVMTLLFDADFSYNQLDKLSDADSYNIQAKQYNESKGMYFNVSLPVDDSFSMPF